MNVFLVIAFLFFVGSLVGWGIEVVYRRLAHGKWINPGFLTGPALPLYGCGLALMYLLCGLLRIPETGIVWLDHVLLVLLLTVVMTVLEYFSGLLALKWLHLRLWDYSKRPGNVQGLICPLFSLIWGLVGAGYYFLLHDHVNQWLYWLSRNLAFSFFIGMFYGILLLDVAYSLQLVSKIRKWTNTSGVIVRYEALKETIYENRKQHKEKARFFFLMHAPQRLQEELNTYRTKHPSDLLRKRQKKKEDEPKH